MDRSKNLRALMQDSEFMPLDGHKSSRRKVSFDPTVNLGHLLTFIGFIATGTVGYFDLRERIAINEQRVIGMGTEMKDERARTSEQLKELKADMREVRQGINDLLRREERHK